MWLIDMILKLHRLWNIKHSFWNASELFILICMLYLEDCIYYRLELSNANAFQKRRQKITRWKKNVHRIPPFPLQSNRFQNIWIKLNKRPRPAPQVPKKTASPRDLTAESANNNKTTAAPHIKHRKRGERGKAKNNTRSKGQSSRPSHVHAKFTSHHRLINTRAPWVIEL